MPDSPKRYFSFMLRIWQVDGETTHDWRASLEDTHSGSIRGFKNTQSLFTYIKNILKDRQDIRDISSPQVGDDSESDPDSDDVTNHLE
jgi:hypothetical protein